LYRLARGEAEPPPRRREPDPEWQLARQFESPLADRLTLQAVLERLATELAGRLQDEHRAAGALTLRVENEDDARQMQQILRRPVDDAGRIRLHLHALLEQFSLDAPVTAVVLSAGNLAPGKAQQLSLFAPPATHGLARLLPVIMARHRAVDFYRPRLADRAHPLPERRFQLQPL
jgi:hypothetical protein